MAIMEAELELPVLVQNPIIHTLLFSPASITMLF